MNSLSNINPHNSFLRPDSSNCLTA